MQIQGFPNDVPGDQPKMQTLQDIETILKMVTDWKLDSASDISCQLDFRDIPSTSGYDFNQKEIEPPLVEERSENNLPSYVVPVLYDPKKTLSPNHIKEFARNLQMPLSSTYQKELSKKSEKNSLPNSPDLSFPYTRKLEKGRFPNDFIVYPLTDGARISEYDRTHKELKYASTAVDPVEPADCISFRYKHYKSKWHLERYTKVIENYLNHNLNNSSLYGLDQETKYDCFNGSSTSIPEEIISVLSPSEQQIYKTCGGRLKSSTMFKNVLGIDEQVQAASSVATMETMVEPLQICSSVQTLVLSPYMESLSKITQTGIKNVEKVLILLPQEKIIENSSLKRIVESVDEELESKELEGASMKPALKRGKTVRIDPRFIKKETPHSEGEGIRTMENEAPPANIKEKKRKIPLYKHTVMKNK